MVEPHAIGVHAERGRRPRRPAFPQGDQNAVSSWAQTAIIPTNSAIDVKAAASSTKIRNITTSLVKNIEGTLFLFCSEFKRGLVGQFESDFEINRLVMEGLK
jgi:hypothetical protein